MNKHPVTAIFAAVVCLSTSTSCSDLSTQAKAGGAKPSGYLDEAEPMTENRERYPFNRVWISPDWPEKRAGYHKVILAPVNLDYLETMAWWQTQNSRTKESLKEDQARIAAYMSERFEEAIRNDPRHEVEVVSQPGPDTVVLELALVELIPSKIFFNAAATAGGFFVPGTGALGALGKGSVAIEGRLKDSTTGTVFVQMADREENKHALVDVAGLTWYDGAKDAIDDWARQFVELADTPLTAKVNDSSPFTLITW